MIQERNVKQKQKDEVCSGKYTESKNRKEQIYIYIYVYVYITLCDINQTGKGLARTLANLGIKIGSNAINSVLGEK